MYSLFLRQACIVVFDLSGDGMATIRVARTIEPDLVPRADGQLLPPSPVLPEEAVVHMDPGKALIEHAGLPEPVILPRSFLQLPLSSEA